MQPPTSNSTRRPVDYTQGPVPQSTGYQGGTITEAIANRAFTPGLPYGATVSPVGTAFNANQAMDTSVGQVSGAITPSVMGQLPLQQQHQQWLIHVL